MEPATKRKMLLIATHSGTFHADEALAVAMLRQLPQFADARLLRTRDPAAIADADLAVDVGGRYEPAAGRFDHHQADFAHTMHSLDARKPWTVRLSSAGLVYQHYGRDVLRRMAAETPGAPIELDDETLEQLFDKVYENFLIEIDGIDNGVNAYDTKEAPRYRIQTGLSSRVGDLNPTWREERSEQTLNERFERAVALTGAEFRAKVRYYLDCWLAGRQIVLAAVQRRHEVDAGGELIEFDRDQPFPPFEADLFDVERRLDIVGQIKYCVFFDPMDQTYRVRAIAEQPRSFSLRVPLPAEWRGRRDAELNALVGRDDCVFVHASGFIGGVRSRETALELCRQSLKLARAALPVSEPAAAAAEA